MPKTFMFSAYGYIFLGLVIIMLSEFYY